MVADRRSRPGDYDGAPTMSTLMPRAQRARALRDALRGAQSIGPISLPVAVGLTAGFAASFAVDALLYGLLDTPWRQLADAAAFAAVAAPVWLAVQRSDVRDAIEVLTWLNGWETERWEGEVGRRLPGLPRMTPQLVESLPDTMGLRPLRIELLAAHGDTDGAWQRLEHLPRDTAWQRFEHAALTEWVLWWTDGPPHVARMRAAMPEIDDPERRLAAAAMIGAAEARRAAVSGGDAIRPLAAVRASLGSRPRRYAFPYRTGVVISVLLISVVAIGAVLLTSAFIR